MEKIKALDNQETKLSEYDDLRGIIDNIFDGKIGEPPTPKELEDIYEDGDKRYKIKYPPGFKDQNNKKKEEPYLCSGMSFKREYGDLILWKEILKKVNSSGCKHIIFITDDGKEDWWRKEEGKIVDIRPELVEEIHKAGASLFYMYTPERFLKFAPEYICVDIQEESIRQVENIAELNREEENSTPETLASYHTPNCPRCNSEATIVMHQGVVAGQFSNIWRLVCSNCGSQNVLQYESLEF